MVRRLLVVVWRELLVDERREVVVVCRVSLARVVVGVRELVVVGLVVERPSPEVSVVVSAAGEAAGLLFDPELLPIQKAASATRTSRVTAPAIQAGRWYPGFGLPAFLGPDGRLMARS